MGCLMVLHMTETQIGLGNMYFSFSRSKIVNLFIRAGQSNEVGSVHDVHPPTAYLPTGLDGKILIHSSSGTAIDDAGNMAGNSTDIETDGWTTVEDMAALSRYNYGPEWAFARELAYNNQVRNVGIIKWARNGTRLGRDWRKTDAELYPTFVAYCNQAIVDLVADGWIVRVKAICWNQGHGDTGDDTAALNYGTNLSQLITDLRADITGASDAKLVVVKGADFWRLPFLSGEPAENAQKVINIDNVRAGQAAAVAADTVGATLVDTDTVTQAYFEPWVTGVAGNNPTHWLPDSKQEIGVLSAQQFLTL